MAIARRSVLKGLFVAGGLTAAAAFAFSGALTGATPADGVITHYTGADDPAALQNVITQKSQDQFAMVMFHAPWCPYCEKLTTQLSDAADQTDIPYTVVKVDVEKYPTLVARHKLQGGIPETHVYLDGQRKDVFVGSGPDMATVVSYIDGLTRHYEAPATKPYISTPEPYSHSQ